MGIGGAVDGGGAIVAGATAPAVSRELVAFVIRQVQRFGRELVDRNVYAVLRSAWWIYFGFSVNLSFCFDCNSTESVQNGTDTSLFSFSNFFHLEPWRFSNNMNRNRLLVDTVNFRKIKVFSTVDTLLFQYFSNRWKYGIIKWFPII